MSEFDDTYNDNEVECPYCGNVYQPETEDFDVDERPEECEECGKRYYVHQSFDVSHQTRPDCELNGEKHNYEMVSLNSGKQHPFCTICDKCQPFKELH